MAKLVVLFVAAVVLGVMLWLYVVPVALPCLGVNAEHTSYPPYEFWTQGNYEIRYDGILWRFTAGNRYQWSANFFDTLVSVVTDHHELGDINDADFRWFMCAAGTV